MKSKKYASSGQGADPTHAKRDKIPNEEKECMRYHDFCACNTAVPIKFVIAQLT